jgi:molybdopterin synthase catalytic subunit
MYVVGIAGGGATLADRLVDRLGADGSVARVRRGEDLDGPDPGASVAYRLDGDGRWTARGGALSLDGLLDRLAPEVDYAVVEGFPEADVPRVVVGDADAAGETVVAAADAGSVDPDRVAEALASTEPRETLHSLVARAKAADGAERAGAVATFTGRVRAKDGPDDPATEYLEFEKYEGVADRRMATIREELTDREGVAEVLLHHRTGVVEDGEDIVFVVVLAGHRDEAFRTVRDGIDRLKDEVPLFKREVTVEEEFWVHERE